MAEPSPTADAPGPEPEAIEGQEPEPGVVDEPDAPDGPKGRSYSESYVRQLRRESAGYRSRLSEIEAKLQEREDADKTESEKLTAKLADAEKRASDSELRLLRLEVGAERGLPADAIQFLTGTTREEIELRAEELDKLLGARKPAGSGFDGGARRPVPEPTSPEEAHNALLLESIRGRGRT